MPREPRSPGPLPRERDVHFIATTWTTSETGWIGSNRGQRACVCDMPVLIAAAMTANEIGAGMSRPHALPLPLQWLVAFQRECDRSSATRRLGIRGSGPESSRRKQSALDAGTKLGHGVLDCEAEEQPARCSVYHAPAKRLTTTLSRSEARFHGVQDRSRTVCLPGVVCH